MHTWLLCGNVTNKIWVEILVSCLKVFTFLSGLRVRDISNTYTFLSRVEYFRHFSRAEVTSTKTTLPRFQVRIEFRCSSVTSCRRWYRSTTCRRRNLENPFVATPYVSVPSGREITNGFLEWPWEIACSGCRIITNTLYVNCQDYASLCI